MHTIKIDHDTMLIDVRLTGFFDPDAAKRVIEDVRDAVRSLRNRSGEQVTLYDASAVDVAPPATIDELKRAWTDPAIRHLWARKVAYVTPSALGRMQLKRLREARNDIAIFADRATALDWLLAA